MYSSSPPRLNVVASDFKQKAITPNLRPQSVTNRSYHSGCDHFLTCHETKLADGLFCTCVCLVLLSPNGQTFKLNLLHFNQIFVKFFWFLYYLWLQQPHFPSEFIQAPSNFNHCDLFGIKSCVLKEIQLCVSDCDVVLSLTFRGFCPTSRPSLTWGVWTQSGSSWWSEGSCSFLALQDALEHFGKTHFCSSLYVP